MSETPAAETIDVLVGWLVAGMMHATVNTAAEREAMQYVVSGAAERTLAARGVRVGDEGLRAALLRIEGWSRYPKGLTRPGVTRTIGLIHEEAEQALAAIPTPPEIDQSAKQENA